MRTAMTFVVVVVGLVALSDLLGGPSFGKWQSAAAGAALAIWWLGFNSGMRSGDRTERRIFWIGLSCAAFLFAAGIADGLAG